MLLLGFGLSGPIDGWKLENFCIFWRRPGAICGSLVACAYILKGRHENGTYHRCVCHNYTVKYL